MASEDAVVAEMTALIAAVTGASEDDARQAAQEVVADAAAPGGGDVPRPKVSRAFNPAEKRDPRGKWVRGGGEPLSLGGAAHKLGTFLSSTEAGKPAPTEVVAAAQRAQDAVANILGADVRWNGQAHVQSARQMGANQAQLNWDGDLQLRQDFAGYLADAYKSDTAPIVAPAAETLEHEMFHGAGASAYDGPAYQGSRGAASIEESFTELGASQHAPEFIDQMGWSDREAVVPQDPYLGPAAKPGETMGQYSRRLASRVQLAQGGWRHYSKLTQRAWAWANGIAGLTSRPVTDVTDEINRVGTADKPVVMARQILGARGVKADPNRVSLMAGTIVQAFGAGKGYTPGHALEAARTLADLWLQKDKGQIA